MNAKHSGTIETVKAGLVAAITGTGDIVPATVDTITKEILCITRLQGQ
jgi:hypothetical protein